MMIQMLSIIYLFLAIFGLGVLVFIHELGHYLIALRLGMRVEAFSIGFGKPLLTWKARGVEWRLCLLPFGGYVKIAGMQRENGKDPFEIKDGFFGKSPLDRIKVALAGPLVNILFALLLFSLLWVFGGREKNFSQFTHKIGWIKVGSPLYNLGVRPGDEISSYGGRPFHGFQDLINTSFLKDQKTQISGYSIDYFNREKTPFDYTLNNYETPSLLKLRSIGIAAPASYLIFEGPSVFYKSPLIFGGIQKKDRIVWANGELIFSEIQLDHLLSEPSAYLTIKREDRFLHIRVPREKIDTLLLTPFEKDELEDNKHEANLKGPLSDFYVLPALLSSGNVVTKKFIESPLQVGDTILAVDGSPVSSSSQLYHKLQVFHALILVQRDPSLISPISWKGEDKAFDASFHPKDIEKIIRSIGTPHPILSSGTYHLLSPVVPITFDTLPPQVREERLQRFKVSQQELAKIDDPEIRQKAEQQLQKELYRSELGVDFYDRTVTYNPNPFSEFYNVLKETGKIFASLISGSISPKWLSGPVGIVRIMQISWSHGIKEALFWMGMISLNLGLLNLLPIPMLDGGYISLSFFEMVTKRRLKPKTMERLIIPFVVLFIGFMIYVTYNDLSHIFSRFF